MTPQRFQKLRRVLDNRQPDLTVLLDNVHKPHNFSAILRSCDAVGVLQAHAVWEDLELRPNHLTSGGTAKWVGIRTHSDIYAAAAELRELGFHLVAAHPEGNAQDYREIDYTRPTALVLGAELQGLGNAALECADTRVRVPMMGMVESLNVSVAAATILFEAQRQRSNANLYAESRLEPAVYEKMLFEWAHPVVARYCRRYAIEYPDLNEDGDIVGSLPKSGRPL
jgi:tRNA (guanosine-2'-O-)-methyltransferase